MRFIIAALMATLPSIAIAETAADEIITLCSKLAERRVECLETAVRSLAQAPTVEGAKTKEIVGQGPLEYKVVDADDLYVSPNKFRGRGVELRGMACFHADQSDYRCIAPRGVTLAIFAKEVSPPDARSKLEDDCGQIKKAATAACRRTIRFVANEFDADTVSGYQNRIVFRPTNIEVVAQAKDKRKR